MSERLYLFDTTLRDGAQTPGIDFSVEDKIQVAGCSTSSASTMSRAAIPAPTRPTPPSSPRSGREGALHRLRHDQAAGRHPLQRPGLPAILDAADAVCFVAKTWDYHVRVALGTTAEENLDGIRQSVEAARAAGKETMVDCEHFFDGYKANPDYALACARTAFDAGARWVVLCDTNGGTLPDEVEAIVARGGDRRCRATISASTPTTTPSQAVANTLAAVRAGARQIQGTLNGIGERCGNANLTSLIPTLLLKPGSPTASRPASRRGALAS